MLSTTKACGAVHLRTSKDGEITKKVVPPKRGQSSMIFWKSINTQMKNGGSLCKPWFLELFGMEDVSCLTLSAPAVLCRVHYSGVG